MLLRDVWTGGIDWSLPGNGGLDCASYLSPTRKLVEFWVGVAISAFIFFIGFRIHVKPKNLDLQIVSNSTTGYYTKCLLFTLGLTYSLEMFYKLVTYQLIFIVNPCHCLCLVQMLILYLMLQIDHHSSTQTLTYIFRLHLHILHGPLMAVVFPVTNTLFLPLEIFTYWLEHALLLGIPIYLICVGKISVPQNTFQDTLGWGFMAYGLWGLFHFLILLPLATFSLANLNSILCPSITDPFSGQNYRSWAMIHQLVLTLFCGFFLSLFGRREVIQN